VCHIQFKIYVQYIQGMYRGYGGVARSSVAGKITKVVHSTVGPAFSTDHSLARYNVVQEGGEHYNDGQCYCMRHSLNMKCGRLSRVTVAVSF
jgi:hypothetical protein